MELDLPDPITNYNRQIARQRYLRREEYVLDHHPGFNLVYWRRIVRAPARVERWGRRWGWTRDQIMLTQALLVSRMACVFIDHLIRRMGQKLGVTQVVVTHDMRSLYHVADHVAYLREGRIYFTGTPQDLRQNRDPLVRDFIQGRSRDSIEAGLPEPGPDDPLPAG